MAMVKSMIPFCVMPQQRARGVSWVARASNAAFGSPNVRRGNGILSTRFDVAGLVRRMAHRLFGARRSAPVYSVDRVGVPCAESLPRVWLSERVSNTRSDDGRRVFVECYPNCPDKGGTLALELGDRYLGEGCSPAPGATRAERVECVRAAEILYLHAVRRGNRTAASRLKVIYDYDLGAGSYWSGYIESRAKHAKRFIREAAANGRQTL